MNLAKGERLWGFKWGVNYIDKEQCNITKSIFRPKEISYSHAGPPMVTTNKSLFSLIKILSNFSRWYKKAAKARENNSFD